MSTKLFTFYILITEKHLNLLKILLYYLFYHEELKITHKIFFMIER